jgi:hypothetical protein
VAEPLKNLFGVEVLTFQDGGVVELAWVLIQHQSISKVTGL